MSGFRHAFSISKQQVQDAVPPGTVSLSIHSHQILHGSSTKHEGELILYPQPSSDPADPLNWPVWRKSIVLLCMSVYAFLGNFTSSSIASAFPLYATPLAFNPPVGMGRLSHLIAVNVLMMGAGNIWWVPLANTFGRRPITLINILLLTLCSMWAGLATTFESLLAARFFMGVGVGPADTIAPNVIGEIYFTHQRGKAMGFYTAFLSLGSLVGGITGGYTAGNHGLAWLHWVNVILCAILFVACALFVPETLYKRDEPSPTILNAEKALKEGGETSQVEEVITQSQPQREYPAFTFARSLKLYTYHGNLARNFLAPWLTLRLPGVWLVMLWYAGLVGGIVTLSTVGPSIVAYPPYSWGKNAGLINVGGIIGAILGAATTGILADRVIVTKKTIKDGEFMEPEARLLVALPGLILATTGLWVFGFCAQNAGAKMWVGMQFGIGMLSFGLMQAPSVGFNYIIDSYRNLSADCFVAITCMRAIISFSWTFFVGHWVEEAGPAVPFGVFGGIMGFFTLLLFPQWMWGKRTRIATAKWVG
ncbi:major facilitator superfamily domain-containing protein [Aspergillus karnatakaensis]|uniref:major facilitator superfamily domain-containing protein n=1 Tax=Aspergillus karnatakaensis TaxID=1810916 RepID=UPI003CCD0D2A